MLPESRTCTRASPPLALCIVVAALTGCATPHPITHNAPTTAARPSAAGTPAAQPADATLHAAVQAAQSRPAQLDKARIELNRLLADERTEARALHPYARALLEQILERQRLTHSNERLVRELDAQAQALELSQQDNTALRSKLDALAEIELSLPLRGQRTPILPENTVTSPDAATAPAQ
jgi:hypothetical protein